MAVTDQTGIKVVTLESGATLEINFDQKLGQGSFGAVYGGKFQSADGSKVDHNVAIKIPFDSGNDADIDKETKMNLIQGLLYEQSKVGDKLYIVMPNLGRPIPNELPTGANLSDTIIEEGQDDEDEDEELAAESKFQSSPPLPASSIETGTTVINDDRYGTTVFKTQEIETPAPAASGYGTTVMNDDEYGTTVFKMQETESPAPVASGYGTTVTDDNEYGTTVFKTQGTESPAPGDTDNVYATTAYRSNAEETNPAAVVQKPEEIPNLAAALASTDQVSPSKKIKTSPLEQPPKPLEMIEFSDEEFNLKIDETLDIFEQMAAEVERAHNNGILHLDIKGENFLYDKDKFKVSLIDFGISEFMADNTEKIAKGSLPWIAPELIINVPTGNFSTEQDVYSLGRSFVMALTGPLLSMSEETLKHGLPVPIADINLGVRRHMRDMKDWLVQLQNVQFNNENNIPEIQAMNRLIAVMNKMTLTNPVSRPNLSGIREELTAINVEFKQAKALEANYIKALENVPFEGNKMADRFLAQTAIREFDKQQEMDWLKRSREMRGDKPQELSIPNKGSLDRYIDVIKDTQKELQAEKEQSAAPVTPQTLLPAAQEPILAVAEVKDAEPELQDAEPELQDPEATAEDKDNITAPEELPLAMPPLPEKPQVMPPLSKTPENDEIAALAIGVSSPSIFNSAPNSSQQVIAPPKQTNDTEKADQEDTVNKLIKDLRDAVSNYHKKTVQKTERQNSSAFTPLLIKFSGDKKEASDASAKLFSKLRELLVDNTQPAEKKLDSLKEILNSALSDHENAYRNSLNKGQNSDFRQMYQSFIERIAECEDRGPQVVAKAKNS